MSEIQTSISGLDELERTPSGWAVMKQYLQTQGLRWYADPLRHGYYSVKVLGAREEHHRQLTTLALKVKIMPWDGTPRYVVVK